MNAGYWNYLFEGFNNPDLALCINRVAVGTFFFLSGYHKLSNKHRHWQLVRTLKECKVRYIRFCQWFVPSVEFFGGISVASGIVAPLAALGMLALLGVAISTSGVRQIKSYAPFIDDADLVDDVLYVPEDLYFVMLAAVIFGGVGAYSLHIPLMRFLLHFH